MADLSVTDIVAIIGVVAAVITAIGVFIGPNLAERARRKEVARTTHLAKIRTHVILTIKAGIDARINQLTPSDSTQVIINRTDEKMPKWSLSLFTTPLSVRTGLQGSMGLPTTDYAWFDKILFHDLENHFPTLKENIDKAEKVLESRGNRAMELRWMLALKIFTLAQQPVSMITTGNISPMGVTISGGLMFLTDVPQKEWPNIYEAASQYGIIPILEGLRKDTETMKLAREWKEERQSVERELVALGEALQQVIESEKRLPGNCDLLP